MKNEKAEVRQWGGEFRRSEGVIEVRNIEEIRSEHDEDEEDREEEEKKEKKIDRWFGGERRQRMKREEKVRDEII